MEMAHGAQAEVPKWVVDGALLHAAVKCVMGGALRVSGLNMLKQVILDWVAFGVNLRAMSVFMYGNCEAFVLAVKCHHSRERFRP